MGYQPLQLAALSHNYQAAFSSASATATPFQVGLKHSANCDE